MEKQHSNHILGLDLLRAAAAVMVMLFHFTVWDWQHSPDRVGRWPAFYKAIAPFTNATWVGVEIFFVISGFIIMYSVENIGPATFARHRVLRLLPSALICASLTALILVVNHTYPTGTIAWLWLRSVSFWPHVPWIDGSYWTLPIELAFYFVVFLCLWVRRTSLPYVMAAVGIISTLFNTILVPSHLYNPVSLYLHGCFFGFGVFLYEILRSGFTLLRALVLALCLAGCLAEIGKNHQILADSFWIGGVLLLIASVYCNDWAHRHIGDRTRRMLRKLGLLTYPLYLVHDQLGRLSIDGLHDHFGVPYSIALWTTILGLILLAALIVEFAEQRVRALLSRVLPKASSTAVHPPVSLVNQPTGSFR